MSFSPIARLIFRGTHEGDGLIIGTALKTHNFFRANTVYELSAFDGEMMIREVGESVVSQPGPDHAKSPVRASWGSSVNELLHIGPELFLSRDEYEMIMKKRAAESGD